MFSISFQGARSLFSSAARSPRSRPDEVMHRPDDVGGADPVGLQELARLSRAGQLPDAEMEDLGLARQRGGDRLPQPSPRKMILGNDDPAARLSPLAGARPDR